MSLLGIKTFSQACLALFAPGINGANFLPRSYAFLQRLVSAEFIACGVYSESDHTLSISSSTTHAGFAPAMQALGAHMRRYALFRWDPRVNEGRPFCRSQFFSKHQFRELDIYHDVYRPLGIDNHCAVHVPTKNQTSMFFGLERAGGPDFSTEELELLEAAQIQLANAHQLAAITSMAVPSALAPEHLARFGLTPREAETLYWLALGKTNQEIALILQISLYTVKAHVGTIFTKLGVENRLAAAVWARERAREDSKSPSTTTPESSITIHVAQA